MKKRGENVNLSTQESPLEKKRLAFSPTKDQNSPNGNAAHRDLSNQR